jgi:hypothetical protein
MVPDAVEVVRFRLFPVIVVVDTVPVMLQENTVEEPMVSADGTAEKALIVIGAVGMIGLEDAELEEVPIAFVAVTAKV